MFNFRKELLKRMTINNLILGLVIFLWLYLLLLLGDKFKIISWLIDKIKFQGIISNNRIFIQKMSPLNFNNIKIMGSKLPLRDISLCKIKKETSIKTIHNFQWLAVRIISYEHVYLISKMNHILLKVGLIIREINFI